MAYTQSVRISKKTFAAINAAKRSSRSSLINDVLRRFTSGEATLVPETHETLVTTFNTDPNLIVEVKAIADQYGLPLSTTIALMLGQEMARQ